MRQAALVVAVVALVTGGTASAATSPWAKKANALCRVYEAKAKALVGSAPVKTAADAHNLLLKAVPLKAAEAKALTRIPGPTAAGRHALAVLANDVAEGRVTLAAWKTSKARFGRLFNAYVNDHRPKQAFAAAGATACG